MAKMICDGWWEQSGLGRQSMEELIVDYDDGRITGQGTDVVGNFTLRGKVSEGSIRIDKWYIGKHTVIYTGASDGEGGYSGDWTIGGVEGGKWAIRFRSLAEENINPNPTSI